MRRRLRLEQRDDWGGATRWLASASGLTVKATEYNFDVTGDAAGGFNNVTFENDGKEPHILVAIKLQPGKTVADALPLLAQEGEPDPAAVAAVFDGDPGRGLLRHAGSPCSGRQ